MRVTDYDKLQLKLREYADRKASNGEIELANGILKAKCFIGQECEVFDEQQLNDGWIPVSKPPNEYGTYMVAWRPINMTETDVKIRTRSKITHFYEILEYDPEDEAGWVETIEQSEGAYEILAWQPLPEPYKEVSE